jgi:hypothetical protein
MLYLLAGPLVAVVGIAAVFFVMRRKSVDKRSMYSARRSQIEHKVRAARQRTLTPHGHAEKPADATTVEAAPSPFAQTAAQQPTINYPTPAYQATAAPAYEAPPAPAYEAPAAAPPTPPPAAPPPPAWETPAAPAEAAPMPWESGPSAPVEAPPAFGYPAPGAPAEPFVPAAEPTPRAQPSEPAWTPAPRPAEEPIPLEQPVAAGAPSAAGSWSVVSSEKDSAISETSGRRKDSAADGGSWSLASGEAPGTEAEGEGEVRRPNRTLVAAAQYAVLVVGLVMVLIGVLVMVANSHVT